MQHEHSLVIKLSVSLGLGAEVTPVSDELAPSCSHGRDASRGARRKAIDAGVLDVRARPLDVPEVAAFPLGVDRAHEVQVLRHRLPPFLGKAFGGKTGLVDVAVRSHTLDQAVDEDRDVR